MQVKDLMAGEPIAIEPGTPCDEAWVIQEKCGFRHLPVVAGGRLVGILSDRDLLRAGSAAELGGLASPEQRRGMPLASELMTASVATVAPHADVLEATQILLQQKIDCLPVVDGGQLVGIVTSTDLLGAYVLSCELDPANEVLNPPLRERMTANVISVRPTTRVEEALAMCATADIRHLLVTADESSVLLGLVSDRDLRCPPPSGADSSRCVRELMTEPAATLAPGDRLAAGARAMLEAGVDALPVLEQRKLVGILTASDVLDHCLTTAGAYRARGA